MVKLAQIGKTQIEKNPSNEWTAKTYFNIVGGPHDGRQLKILTEYAKYSFFKGMLGLYTIGQVVTLEKKGGEWQETFTVFEDPSETLVRFVECRGTEKEVRDQHEKAIKTLNDLRWLE